jgi:hypothetical protein
VNGVVPALYACSLARFSGILSIRFSRQIFVQRTEKRVLFPEVLLKGVVFQQFSAFGDIRKRGCADRGYE